MPICVSESLKTAGLVVVLAAGIALVPRLLHGLGGSAPDSDAPAFEAKVVLNADAEHETKSMSLAELKGRPVVIDFWASWCGPCRAEAPIVDGLARRYKDKGVVVIGMNTQDEVPLAQQFAKSKNLSFPILFDADNSIAQHYRVDSLPTLVVINKEGKISAIRHGVTSDADLDRLIKEVL